MSHFRLAVWTHRSQLLYLYCTSVSLLHWIATWYIHVSFKNVIQSDKQHSNNWKHLNIRAATAALQACLCFKNQSPKLQSITPILNDLPISSNKLLTNSFITYCFHALLLSKVRFFPRYFYCTFQKWTTKLYIFFFRISWLRFTLGQIFKSSLSYCNTYECCFSFYPIITYIWTLIQTLILKFYK